MMRSSLRKEVNCESCDHFLYLTNRHGDVVGYDCEYDHYWSIDDDLPLHELQCHSLYELYEMEQERLSDIAREEVD